jgi:flagellar protein FlbD
LFVFGLLNKILLIQSSIVMIKVTLLNDTKVYLNADMIELVEEKPDTIITLSTNKKIIVKEKIDEIITRVISYKRRIYNRKLLNSNWEECSN